MFQCLNTIMTNEYFNDLIFKTLKKEVLFSHYKLYNYLSV
jgi:hypothetical protein